jgi:hypothetical protein
MSRPSRASKRLLRECVSPEACVGPAGQANLKRPRPVKRRVDP